MTIASVFIMVFDEVRRDVTALINAVSEHPQNLPISELARVAEHGVDVSVERRSGDSIAIITRRADPVFSVLSDREHQVATLVAAGLSNTQVATSLFISLATAKDHMHAVLTKTGFNSRAQMIAAWFGGMRSDPFTPERRSHANGRVTGE